MNIKTSLNLILLALVLAGSNTVLAAKYKCWKNNEGVRECGTKVPPEFAQKGHEEISKHGTVVGETDRIKNEEELEEAARQAAIDAEKKKQEEEQTRQDKILLDTFSNVDDINMTRDGKITFIQTSINLTKKRIEKIQQDLDKRIEAAAAAERSGKAPNQDLLKDIASLKRQIKNNEKFIIEKKKEQGQVKESYAGDVARFKELKGIKDSKDLPEQSRL